MQIISKALIIFGLVISIFFFGKIVFAQDSFFDKDFSAGIVSAGAGGKGDPIKIYFSKGKIRIGSPSQDVSIIIREDKGVFLMLMPKEKVFMEQPLTPKNIASLMRGIKIPIGKIPDEIERKHLGAETVDGRKTEKYKITVAANNKVETIFQWIDADSDFPIRTFYEISGQTVDFINLLISKQPDNLFDIPEGYQKMLIQPKQ